MQNKKEYQLKTGIKKHVQRVRGLHIAKNTQHKAIYKKEVIALDLL